MFRNHKKVFYFSAARYSKMLSIVKTDLDFVKIFCNFVVTGSRKQSARIPAIFLLLKSVKFCQNLCKKESDLVKIRQREVEKRLGFPQEAIAAFEKVARKIEKSKSFSKKFEEIYNKYMKPEAHDFGKCMDELGKLSMFRGVNKWTMQMVFLIVAAEDMHKLYKERNLSDELFWFTLMDLKYKYRECVDCKGAHGTFFCQIIKPFTVALDFKNIILNKLNVFTTSRRKRNDRKQQKAGSAAAFRQAL
mgnify:CR=1 FL=1